MRRGFTIVELAVSCGVVVVGLCLLRVAAAEDRQAAVQATDLGNLGLSARDFLAYPDDHADAMPNFGLPGDPASDWYYIAPPRQERPNPETEADLYQDIFSNWTRVLDRWKGRVEAYWYPEQGPKPRVAWAAPPHPSQFKYSLTMVTMPTLWTWPGRRNMSTLDMAREYEVVRKAAIAMPARKGVLVYDKDDKRTDWIVAFADGSTSARRVSDGAPGAQVVWSTGEIRGRPVLSTVNGYLGRDY